MFWDAEKSLEITTGQLFPIFESHVAGVMVKDILAMVSGSNAFT